MALSLPGCDPGTYTGGGFIDSAAGGNAKATFGFDLEALDRDRDGQADQVIEKVIPDPEVPDDFYYVAWWTAKGQFNYNDQGAGGFTFELVCRGASKTGQEYEC